MVLKVGRNVTNIAVGDEVFGMTGFVLKPSLDMFNPEKLAGGAYATIATLKAGEAALKPANSTHAEAAAVPLAGLTVWAALVDAAKLKPGCKVLVLGGSGNGLQGLSAFPPGCLRALQTCPAPPKRKVFDAEGGSTHSMWREAKRGREGGRGKGKGGHGEAAGYGQHHLRKAGSEAESRRRGAAGEGYELRMR